MVKTMGDGSGVKDRQGRVGTGMKVVRCRGKRVRVVEVVKDSNAYRAGILPGTFITSVEGYDVRQVSFKDLVTRHLLGKQGSRVTVEIIPPDTKEKKCVTIIRGAVSPGITR